MTVFEVVEVDLDDLSVSMMTEEPKDRANADAVERMAIMRRGGDDCFHAVVEAGKYQDGDKWNGGAK